MNEAKRFFVVKPKSMGSDSEVYLPTECHYLYSCYHRIGPLAPNYYLDYIWEAFNILYENFPGHLVLHQDGLPEDCLISE